MRNFKLSVLALAALFLFSCSGSKQEEKSSLPMFWSWWNYRPNPDRPVNLDSIFKDMKEVGLDGIIMNAPSVEDYKFAIPIANRNGLEVYAWWWGLNLEHDRDYVLENHPDWFQVNRLGVSLADDPAYVQYYRFLCPALPEVREYQKAKFKSLAEVEGLKAIVIDYVRFVDVILPTTLWPRYDVVQDKEYPEFDYGYHPYLVNLFIQKYGYDPRKLEDPSEDERWLQFRCDQVTELVNEYAEIAKENGILMSASPFPTPAMSRRMVRQDWGNWHLDVVFPMIYKNFYTGCSTFISDCTIENVKTANPMTTVMAGLTGINGPEIFDDMDAALNNGAQGIALFQITSLRDPAIRAQFRAYTDSVRTARAKSKINPNATGITQVDTNPFNKTLIMSYVTDRIANYTSLARAAATPELKNVDWTVIQNLVKTPLQAFTSEAYLSRLRSAANTPQRRGGSPAPADPKLQSVVDAIIKNHSSEINLSDYRLVREYRTTKYYQVTELNSGIVYNVDFYLYGDLVSGWEVTPADSFEKFIKRR